jgi:AraC-like DNA-binding protein
LRKAKQDLVYLLKLTGRFAVNDLGFLKARKEQHHQQQKIAGFLEQLKKADLDVSRQILDKQDEIIQKVKLGDTPGAREILNEFLGSIFFASGMNFEVLKVRVIELVVMISRAAIEAGGEAKDLFGLNYSYLTELNRAADLDELLQKLTTVLENFISKVSKVKERRRTMRVSAMKDFIHQNFTRKITAAEVAREAGLSVSRALHLFKEETAIPLSSYINRLKVDYAKYLLLNTETGLANLAHELGFYDQSHFTRMFKSFERMTPSHFRLKYKTEA